MSMNTRRIVDSSMIPTVTNNQSCWVTSSGSKRPLNLAFIRAVQRLSDSYATRKLSGKNRKSAPIFSYGINIFRLCFATNSGSLANGSFVGEQYDSSLYISVLGETVGWILCEAGCARWYHYVCIGLTADTAKSLPSYICYRCSSSTQQVAQHPVAV